MKKRRTIVIEDPCLKKIRDNLRMFLIQVVVRLEDEIQERIESIIYGKNRNFRELTSEEEKEVDKLNLELRKYMSLMRDSICYCDTCQSKDKDMSYNPMLKKWYCIDCFKEFQEEYTIHKPRRIQEGDWDENTEIFYKSFI